MNNLSQIANNAQQIADENIWLVVFIVVGIITAVELAGLTLPGFHTISYIAYHNPTVRWLVAALFVGANIWWLVHSGQPRVR